MTTLLQIQGLLGLIISLMLLIWGLRIYKFFIILLGIFIGLNLGVLFGYLTENNVLLSGLFFAIIFAIIAIPIKKIMLSIGFGILLSFLGIIALQTINPYVLGLFFMIGFVLGWSYFKEIIVASISLLAGMVIIRNFWIKPLIDIDISDWIESLPIFNFLKTYSPNILNELITANIIFFTVFLAVIIWFSIFYQITLPDKEKKSKVYYVWGKIFRKMTKIVLFTIVFMEVLYIFKFPVIISDSIWAISGIPNLFFWAIQVYFLSWGIYWLIEKPNLFITKKRIKLNGVFLFLTLISFNLLFFYMTMYWLRGIYLNSYFEIVFPYSYGRYGEEMRFLETTRLMYTTTFSFPGLYQIIIYLIGFPFLIVYFITKQVQQPGGSIFPKFYHNFVGNITDYFDSKKKLIKKE